MGRGRYTLSFEGDPDQLLTALGDRVLEHNFQKKVNSEIIDARLLLRPDVAIREAIAIVNNTVDIVTFDHALPSMNEIFIQTVKNNEK
jgi:hypothetical protein